MILANFKQAAVLFAKAYREPPLGGADGRLFPVPETSED